MTPPLSLLAFSASLSSPGRASQHSFSRGPEFVQWNKTHELAGSYVLNSRKASDTKRNFALDHPDFGHTTSLSASFSSSRAWSFAASERDSTRHEVGAIKVGWEFNKWALNGIWRFCLANSKVGHVTSTFQIRLMSSLGKVALFILFYKCLEEHRKCRHCTSRQNQK